jgi:hypothetical protein
MCTVLLLYCLCVNVYCTASVLFVCKCVLYYCHRVSTQRQLTNIAIYLSILTGHKDPEGEQKYSCTLSLTSALDGGVVNATPRLLYPGKDPVPII